MYFLVNLNFLGTYLILINLTKTNEKKWKCKKKIAKKKSQFQTF